MTATTTATKRVTVEELWALRDEPYRLALIDGELHRMPGVAWGHGRVAVRCAGVLDGFVGSHRLGAVVVETWFRLFPNRQTVLIPDVAFVRAHRIPPPHEHDRFANLVPDLAVEIVSPSDERKDIEDKRAVYWEAETPEVWWMYPRTREIEVHRRGRDPMRLGPDDLLSGGDLLPGFQVRVADLFAD